VVEFESFAATHPAARHLSLLDLIELDVNVRDKKWPDFQEYVRSLCIPPRLGESMARSRLREHFDDAIVEAAYQALRRGGVVVDGKGRIDLQTLGDPSGLIEALAILLRSEAVAAHAYKRDRISSKMREFYGQVDVHTAVFTVAANFPWASVYGKSNYGLKVAMRRGSRSKTVSLLKSTGVGRIVLNHWPWVPGPELVTG
jgi:hypothetical protein